MEGKKYGKLSEEVPSTLRVREKLSRSGSGESKEREKTLPKSGTMDESGISNINFDESENLTSVRKSN